MPPSRTQRAGEVFARVSQAFFEAAQTDGRTEAQYQVAGQRFELVFAGDALIPSIMPALAPHKRDAATGQPSLRVYLWDTLSTGIPLPDVGWQLLDMLDRHDLSSHTLGSVLAAYNSDDRILTLYDLDTDTAIYCTYDARQVPAFYAASPLKQVFHWWLGRRGFQFIHAGAVGLPDGGALVIGESGAGKSTTTLATLRSALAYVADDFCFVDSAQPPYAYNLYSSGKVNRDNLHRFPHLEPLISNPERQHGDKAMIYLQDAYPDKLLPGFPLKAVLLPRVTGLPTTRITPMPRLEALQPILVSTMRQLIGANERDFKAITRLIGKLPCYRLDAGTDLDGVTRAIHDLLLGL